jgi:glycerophosphoryl diester phosphodiesterase
VNSWRAKPPLIVAHRGASHAAPENTFAAFDLAVAEGADAFEFDVRLTRDGVPVVMHDRDLARVTGRPGLVDELAAADLARYLVEGTEPVPTLADVFSRYAGRVRFDVELKTADAPQPGLVEAVREVSIREGVLDDVYVTSFDPFAVASWRALGGLGGLLLLDPPLPEEAADAAEVFDGILPGIHGLDPETARVAREKGLLLYLWTINDADAARRALALGAHGIITDVPARLRAALS